MDITCSTDKKQDLHNIIIFKDDSTNDDYFSKYLVLKINDESKFGIKGTSVELDTNWKNSKLSRSGIIYKFNYNDTSKKKTDTSKKKYEDESYCDSISLIENEQIEYKNKKYTKLILSKEYLLYYTLPSTTAAATTEAATTAAAPTQVSSVAVDLEEDNTIIVQSFIDYKETFEDTTVGTTAANNLNYGRLHMFLYGELFDDNSHIRIPQIDSNTNCNEEYIFEYKKIPAKLNDLNIKHHKIYVCDINFSNNIKEQAYLVFNSTTDIKIYNEKNKELYDIKKIEPQNVTARTTQTAPKHIDRKYPTLQHNINDHKLHEHTDIMPTKLNKHGDPSRPVHIHNFFDDHHHPEESEWHNKDNSKLEDNYIYSDIKKYKDKKKDIDTYVDKIIIILNKHKSIKSVNDLLKNTELGLVRNNYYNLLNEKLETKLIKTDDVRLKLILREILYNELLNKVEGKTNPVNPLNPLNLPCMYYTDFNCPTEHCKVADTDSRNLNIKCIPNDKKKVSTCLDLYGKNNCEQHYIDDEANTCKWSEWTGKNGRKLGKCSSDGNVPKIKEECSTGNYLIKKYGKGELSNTLIDSICLSKGDETYKLLYDNPNYVNHKYIKESDGKDIDDTNIIKNMCLSNNFENTDNPNEWDNDNCYNLKELECHKNSQEVCDISKDRYLNQSLLDQSSELYDVHKNQVCYWRQLHYSKNPEYSNEYTEKGICENLL